MDNDFDYKFVSPGKPLDPFVESIGMFHNASGEPREVVIMPDGRIDLFFSKTGSEPLRVMLMGLETTPEQRTVAPYMLNYVISFRPLAVEYILHTSIADIVDTARDLANDFWHFTESDFRSFDSFYQKASQILPALLPSEVDERKQYLFNLIYSTNGEMSVKALSGKTFWSSRQINRYFNQQLGLSLKAYCSILRFRASLEHIAQGRLFPELNFTDQAHFIKEIKKFSGVIPKELSRNKNDRFILLSVLKQK